MNGSEGVQDGRPPWGSPGERPGAPRAEDQLADHGIVRRRPSAATTARAVQTWVDQTIAQAERQGAFDNLSGAGKPLRDVDVRNDPDWWVKSLIERERLDLSGAMPGVMQLRREKATYPESLLELSDEAWSGTGSRTSTRGSWPTAAVRTPAPARPRSSVGSMSRRWSRPGTRCGPSARPTPEAPTVRLVRLSTRTLTGSGSKRPGPGNAAGGDPAAATPDRTPTPHRPSQGDSARAAARPSWRSRAQAGPRAASSR